MPKKSLAEEKAALEKRLNEIRRKEAEEAAKRHAIIGKAVEQAAEEDPAVKTQLQPILEKYVKAKSARSLLGLPAVSDTASQP